MSEAIRLNHGLLSHPLCNNCGTDVGVKVFELNVSPEETGRQVISWCPTCARAVAYRLNRVFPEPQPEWIRAMQNIGRKPQEEEDEHS